MTKKLSLMALALVSACYFTACDDDSSSTAPKSDEPSSSESVESSASLDSLIVEKFLEALGVTTEECTEKNEGAKDTVTVLGITSEVVCTNGEWVYSCTEGDTTFTTIDEHLYEAACTDGKWVTIPCTEGESKLEFNMDKAASLVCVDGKWEEETITDEEATEDEDSSSSEADDAEEESSSSFTIPGLDSTDIEKLLEDFDAPDDEDCTTENEGAKDTISAFGFIWEVVCKDGKWETPCGEGDTKKETIAGVEVTMICTDGNWEVETCTDGDTKKATIGTQEIDMVCADGEWTINLDNITDLENYENLLNQD